MSEALQKLIQQAEEQKLEMEMQILHTRNMSLFKKRFPTIFKLLENHKPSKLVLKLDPNRQINLIDVKNKRWLYNDIPIQICKTQVEQFEKHTKVRKFNVVKSGIQNVRHIHIGDLNWLIDLYDNMPVQRIKHTPKLITNLIVSGVGLGFHISEIIQKFDIKNILIYENCIDTFFASTFTIDWNHIIQYFNDKNRTITFCVGVEPERAMEQIEKAIHGIGLHSHIFTFVLKHSSRQCESDFLKMYLDEIRAFVGGLGYFDDERIGLAHAHHNLHSNHSVFLSRRKRTRKNRVVIVGNGPSLDSHESYLNQIKENAIILSCGTALTSLMRMGIKPDFHVEMERPSFIEDAINFGSTKEQRSGITLLCLHTGSPKTIACFDEACYAIKPNDAGTPLIHDHFKPEKLSELAFSNPTVANCALAFAISMGFIDIHLVGVDLGMKESKKHHSEKSIYYDMERHAEEDNVVVKIEDKDKYRPGNFGGKVKTPAVLDMSRSSMERLLSFVTKNIPEFRCINSNDGVKIKFTESIPIESIPEPLMASKSAEIESIKNDHFLKNVKPKNEDSTNYLKYLFSIKENLKLSRDIQSEDDLYANARSIFKHIQIENDVLTHFLLRGTVNCFLGSIFENTFYCESKDDFIERVRVGIRSYNNTINRIYDVMQTNPFEIDDTINKCIRSMLEDKNQQKSPE